jgi:hypothetical protein
VEVKKKLLPSRKAAAIIFLRRALIISRSGFSKEKGEKVELPFA